MPKNAVTHTKTTTIHPPPPLPCYFPPTNSAPPQSSSSVPIPRNNQNPNLPIQLLAPLRILLDPTAAKLSLSVETSSPLA